MDKENLPPDYREQGDAVLNSHARSFGEQCKTHMNYPAQQSNGSPLFGRIPPMTFSTASPYQHMACGTCLNPLSSPHTPNNYPHTPEWLGGSNPWLMTPRAQCHPVVNSPYHQTYSYSNPYNQAFYQNSPLANMPPPPPHPPVQHLSNPTQAPPQPTHAQQQQPAPHPSGPPPGVHTFENPFIHSYPLRPPPGFQMNENGGLRPETIEKPSYATNLFNQKNNPEYSHPVNPAAMEVAGVFWDIENCAVPHHKSAFALVQRIREKMFHSLREVEFMCACDTSRENKAVTDELNSAQVTVVHIKGTAKNAADCKLRQSIRRFADEHKPPATIILITGDVNFAPDISDLKNRKKCNVILIYPDQAPESLRMSCSTSICYSEFIQNLPNRTMISEAEYLLVVSNLPTHFSFAKNAIKSRLNQLCDNTAGKVINVYGKSGLLKFNSSDMAKRAMKRLNGEDVFGNKIIVSEKRGSSVDLASQFESIPTSPRKRRGNSESHSYASALAKNTKNIQKLGGGIGGVGCLLTRANREGIKLTITNIDAALGEENIRTLLFTKIGKTCELITLEIQPYNRFTMTADVIVPSMKNATDVLQSLQRQRFGKKRILVTLTQQSDMRMNQFRENLSSLLEDGLPMSFSELQYKYESTFGPLEEPICTLENIRRLGSNFIKIEEACQPYSSTTDLCISLASPIRRRPVQQRTIPQSPYSVILPHCDRHVCLGQPVADCSLVKVTCGLREFAAKLHGLLASHQGILQLSSFDICWKAELGAFPDVQDQKGTIGVYLEHLVSFVPGVEIVTSQHGIKVISWAQTGTTTLNTPCETESDSVHSGCTTGTQSGSQGVTHAQNRARAPLGDPNLVALGKEMTDLLKERKGCVLPLNQLINQFQKKYNRNPFRTGVHPIQTLNKLSHVIQLMGIEGRHETRLVTLTHRAQVKRFTQEVVKILKAQADRKCQAYQLPGLYQDIFKVRFQLEDFGVCDLADLLSDVPEGHLETSGDGPNLVIALPKKNRSQDEIMRTKRFGREVADLLRDCDRFSLPFTSFVPSYHHHFGRQCRLSNYGFTKLQDLFEAIPDVVQIEDDQPEKRLALTFNERMAILAEQIKVLFKASKEIVLLDLPKLYFNQFHRRLEPNLYRQISVRSLMDELSDVVMIDFCAKTKQVLVREITKENLENLTILRQELLLLLLQSNDLIDTNQFVKYDLLLMTYQNKYSIKFEHKNYSLSSNGQNFPLVARRSMRDFIDHDEQDGFFLNRLFCEAHKLLNIIIEGNRTMSKMQDRKTRSLLMSYLEHEFERSFAHQNKYSLKTLLDKLTPIIVVRSEQNYTTVALRQIGRYQRTAG